MSLALLLLAFQAIPAAAQAEVAAATAAWMEALNSRDPARIAATYAPDAVFWGTTAKAISPTPESIAAYFASSPSRPTVRVKLGEHYIRVHGDTAINSGNYTFSELRDGQSVLTPARFTFVFHRREGKWLIVDHHSSRMPD